MLIDYVQAWAAGVQGTERLCPLSRDHLKIFLKKNLQRAMPFQNFLLLCPPVFQAFSRLCVKVNVLQLICLSLMFLYLTPVYSTCNYIHVLYAFKQVCNPLNDTYSIHTSRDFSTEAPKGDFHFELSIVDYTPTHGISNLTSDSCSAYVEPDYCLFLSHNNVGKYFRYGNPKKAIA